MTDKNALEEEFTVMQKHFGGLVGLVKELKTKVENLEKNKEPDENVEIKKIVEKQKSKIEELENKIAEKDIDLIESIRENQRIIDKAIAANSAAISKIDKEIQTAAKVTEDANNEDQNEVIKPKKCRYNNCGFCKYKTKCRYTH